MRIGIDLGGTKIEGVAIADDGAQLARVRVQTPRDDYDATVPAMAELVARIERDAGARGTVGVGIPGTISPATGLVKNANSTWLIGRPLGQDLPRLLDRPVRFANDANCFALSEATDGAAAGADVVFGGIIGTGTGGGVVVGRRLLTRANPIAGEWGHNPLPAPRDHQRPGPPRYCGPGRRTALAIPRTRGPCARGPATRAASAARRGCGTDEVRSQTSGLESGSFASRRRNGSRRQNEVRHVAARALSSASAALTLNRAITPVK